MENGPVPPRRPSTCGTSWSSQWGRDRETKGPTPSVVRGRVWTDGTRVRSGRVDRDCLLVRLDLRRGVRNLREFSGVGTTSRDQVPSPYSGTPVGSGGGVGWWVKDYTGHDKPGVPPPPRGTFVTNAEGSGCCTLKPVQYIRTAEWTDDPRSVDGCPGGTPITLLEVRDGPCPPRSITHSSNILNLLPLCVC